MYFGFYRVDSSPKPELCLIPERLGVGSLPLVVKNLVPSDCALVFIGMEEATKVLYEEDGAIVIAPLRPAKLYLSPNRPEKPGYSVTKVKVYFISDHETRVFFDRDKGWEEYMPDRKDY